MCFGRNVRRYEYQLGIRASLLKILCARICKCIEISVFSQEKLNGTSVVMFFYYFENARAIFGGALIICVSTKCNYHTTFFSLPPTYGSMPSGRRTKIFAPNPLSP